MMKSYLVDKKHTSEGCDMNYSTPLTTYEVEVARNQKDF